MPDNLKLWNSVCKTDPKHTKKAKIGQMNITAVCPQHQRMKATEVFGVYGCSWGIRAGSEKYDFMDFGALDTPRVYQKLCTYTATMFYNYEGVECEFPIASNIKVAFFTKNGEGYLKIDDEYAKKAQTDALTKGLSFLGFNADIFLGKFDDNKYIQERADEVAKEEIISGIRPEEISEYNYALDSGDAVLLVDFLNKYFDPKTGQYNEIVIDAFFAGGEEGTKTKRRNKHGEMISEFWQSIGEYVNSLKAAISNLDEIGITEYWDDIQPLKKYMQGQLNQNEINYLKSRASTK